MFVVQAQPQELFLRCVGFCSVIFSDSVFASYHFAENLILFLREPTTVQIDITAENLTN